MILLVPLVGCQSKQDLETQHPAGVNATEQDFTAHVEMVDDALGDISAPAVVYVGERHDQYGYHLNQLAVIAALKQRGLNVAVGLEMVQGPFQQPLDDYIDGGIDLATMLARTEFFTRWRIDPRQYQPIFSYARDHRLPLLALNAAKELTDRVSEVGIDGLEEAERQILPERLVDPHPQYRAVLEGVFKEHQYDDSRDVERFIEVQRARDEVMGKRSVEFLQANSDHILVVLAGLQHVAHGYGIPSRVNNDLDVKSLIVLSDAERNQYSGGADVFLPLIEEVLPKTGRMGVFIMDSSSGVLVGGFAPDSPAKEAGIEENDIILSINGRQIEDFNRLKQLLWDKLPGQSVELEVLRDEQIRTFTFSLY